MPIPAMLILCSLVLQLSNLCVKVSSYLGTGRSCEDVLFDTTVGKIKESVAYFTTVKRHSNVNANESDSMDGAFVKKEPGDGVGASHTYSISVLVVNDLNIFVILAARQHKGASRRPLPLLHLPKFDVKMPREVLKCMSNCKSLSNKVSERKTAMSTLKN